MPSKAPSSRASRGRINIDINPNTFNAPQRIDTIGPTELDKIKIEKEREASRISNFSHYSNT